MSLQVKLEDNLQGLDKQQRKQYLAKLLAYWDLMGDGPKGADVDNKNDVSLIQQILKTSGYYEGPIDGKYNTIIAQARKDWMKDIQQDPDFSWELVKSTGEEIFGRG
jgi:peptidoglycan hydrolase-like protein with peptidoglycan-binding domain